MIRRIIESWVSRDCPACGAKAIRVMYSGFPGKLCESEECSTGWGFWTFMWTIVPFNGHFVGYAKRGYLRALWSFLRGDYMGDSE